MHFPLPQNWASEPDFGFYHALNKCLRRMQAPLYVVVGARDRLAPNAHANYVAARAVQRCGREH
jgi:pimeloyl-ACP methyl ester carboxylesterase